MDREPKFPMYKSLDLSFFASFFREHNRGTAPIYQKPYLQNPLKTLSKINCSSFHLQPNIINFFDWVLIYLDILISSLMLHLFWCFRGSFAGYSKGFRCVDGSFRRSCQQWIVGFFSGFRFDPNPMEPICCVRKLIKLTVNVLVNYGLSINILVNCGLSVNSLVKCGFPINDGSFDFDYKRLIKRNLNKNINVESKSIFWTSFFFSF